MIEMIDEIKKTILKARLRFLLFLLITCPAIAFSGVLEMRVFDGKVLCQNCSDSPLVSSVFTLIKDSKLVVKVAGEKSSKSYELCRGADGVIQPWRFFPPATGEGRWSVVSALIEVGPNVTFEDTLLCGSGNISSRAHFERVKKRSVSPLGNDLSIYTPDFSDVLKAQTNVVFSDVTFKAGVLVDFRNSASMNDLYVSGSTFEDEFNLSYANATGVFVNVAAKKAFRIGSAQASRGQTKRASGEVLESFARVVSRLKSLKQQIPAGARDVLRRIQEHGRVSDSIVFVDAVINGELTVEPRGDYFVSIVQSSFWDDLQVVGGFLADGVDVSGDTRFVCRATVLLGSPDPGPRRSFNVVSVAGPYEFGAASWPANVPASSFSCQGFYLSPPLLFEKSTLSGGKLFGSTVQLEEAKVFGNARVAGRVQLTNVELGVSQIGGGPGLSQGEAIVVDGTTAQPLQMSRTNVLGTSQLSGSSVISCGDPELKLILNDVTVTNTFLTHCAPLGFVTFEDSEFRTSQIFNTSPALQTTVRNAIIELSSFHGGTSLLGSGPAGEPPIILLRSLLHPNVQITGRAWLADVTVQNSAVINGTRILMAGSFLCAGCTLAGNAELWGSSMLNGANFNSLQHSYWFASSLSGASVTGRLNLDRVNYTQSGTFYRSCFLNDDDEVVCVNL